MSDNKQKPSEDTVLLLQESNKGSKTAVNSIAHVLEEVKNEKLKQKLRHYKEVHAQIGEKLHDQLLRYEIEDKEMGMLVKAMANMMTELKLHQGEIDSQIAKLMMDGCNMGIQSLAKYCNQYTKADEDSRRLAEEMLDCEREMMREMEAFL